MNEGNSQDYKDDVILSSYDPSLNSLFISVSLLNVTQAILDSSHSGQHCYNKNDVHTSSQLSTNAEHSEYKTLLHHQIIFAPGTNSKRLSSIRQCLVVNDGSIIHHPTIWIPPNTAKP
jgi:hypothetical protein